MPNWAHVHLILNHVPVVGTPLGILLLLAACRRKSEELKKASLGVFIVMAVLAIPTYLTGEPAEKIVENLPGVSKGMIEQHEEAALVALIALGALGLVCLAGFYFFRQVPAMPTWFVVTVLVMSVMVGALMARTANLGGEVHHQEIRAS